MDNFKKHFKENPTFRSGIVMFIVGFIIILVPNILGLDLGKAKRIISLLGVVITFAATEQLGKIISVIGAEDYEARQAKKKK